ncbi:hypothetical protein SLEP1_g20066 [Rubroshorea leprosula]|uniref:Uncharacterized protein n=1 Tax=Rubroshorea leprosula TaxID=152421 RepID=A0AAV5J1F7_9ROSI|nr:hypothetical protein SLEP1_g20066 [Rubroshorea leprosula]
MLLGRNKRTHRRKRVVLRERSCSAQQHPAAQNPSHPPLLFTSRRRGQPHEIALHIGGKAAAQPTRRDANPIYKEDPEICFFTAQPCFFTAQPCFQTTAHHSANCNSPLFGFCCF